MSLPSKLHRSLHNQLYARQLLNVGTGKNEENNQELVLRQINFAPYLSEILSYCKARLGYITLLDVSCGVLDSSTIATICKHFYQLQTLHAKSCGLCESLDNVKWPDKLQELDLSRNRLSSCPRGIFKLMHLEFINLSGNLISVIPTELLELPQLKKCQFINNPLSNVPKDICREGVVKLRCFFSVEALPMVQSAPYEDKKCKHFGAMSLRRRAHSNSECYPDLRRHLLRCQSSFESDYGSYQASRSPGSTSSNDVDFSEYSDCDSQTSPVSVEVCARPQLPVMMYLPAGYKRSHGNNLCQVYLPENYSEEIEVTIVKDLSMYPILRENELLVTPVVRITPHGLKFGSEPAMIVLPHCSRRSGSNLARYVPICSNTSNSQAPDWVQLDSCTNCIIDDEHVLFSTFHFSLFAVIFILSYPSSSMILHPHMGGTLLVPELPGFQLHVPNNSVSHLNKEVTISSTVHFCDKTYNASDIYAPASACIKLEPHGLQFNFPVEVTVPIPDYPAISHHFPGAKLELWTSANTACHNDIPRRWELMNEVDILVEDLGSNEYKFARFKIDHFSWYEILYKICASSLQTLGLGASYVYSQLPSRMRYIFVRYQAFVSNPHDLTFGLLVAIFKFGDPLTGLSNYPLLVADSGTKRVALHIGYLHVRLTGHFSPTQGVGENLEREGRIIDFTGEDFCERFEFALQLMPSVSLPLQSGQLLGQLHLIQQGRSLSCNLMIVSLY